MKDPAIFSKAEIQALNATHNAWKAKHGRRQGKSDLKFGRQIATEQTSYHGE